MHLHELDLKPTCAQDHLGAILGANLGQRSETCLVLFGEKCFGSFLCFTVVAVLMFAGAAAVFTCTSLHVAMIDPQGAPTLLSCSIGGS